MKKNKKKVCIVVPCYKNTINKYEKISLKHLLKFLGRYDKYFIVPEGLNIKLRGFGNKSFDKRYFNSVKDYNKLMLSKEFYEAFQSYEYILTYQLDCLVFSDQLEYWCDQGYDFIGAPWYKEILPWVKEDSVGNSGFCLRNVQNCLKVLNKIDAKDIRCNDDIFFGLKAKKIFLDFKVAPPEVAVGFSFETAPRLCFRRNNYKLPFGCHAWYRYDKKFWMPYIER